MQVRSLFRSSWVSAGRYDCCTLLLHRLDRSGCPAATSGLDRFRKSPIPLRRVRGGHPPFPFHPHAGVAATQSRQPALSVWEACGATDLLPADSFTCGLIDALPVSDRDCPRWLVRRTRSGREPSETRYKLTLVLRVGVTARLRRETRAVQSQSRMVWSLHVLDVSSRAISTAPYLSPP